MPIMPRRLALVALVFVAGPLAGCGNSAKIPTERFIYTNSEDCAEGGKASATNCDKAIELALLEHDKLPVKYLTLADCEKAEGNDRCERVAERHYRPRLMGYHFTVKGQATAVPLYAGKKGATVFRDAAGATYDWQRTEGVKFSPQAIRKVEGFVVAKRKH